MERETIDCRGSRYTMPLVKLARAMKTAEPGTEVEVVCDYTSFKKELELWCGNTNNQIKEISTDQGVTRAVVVKS
jgi:TusA-related sulfurtransferase